MIATKPNGRMRRSLADQLDRFDHLLDGLAEGLQEAVAQAVQQALQTALTDLLSRPHVQQHLHAAFPVQEPADQGTTLASSGPSWKARVSFWGRGLLDRGSRGLAWCGSGLAWTWRSCAQRAQGLIQQTHAGCRQVGEALGCLQRLSQALASRCCLPVLLLWRVRWAVGTALLLGFLGGLASCYAGVWLATLLSALSTFTTTLNLHQLVAHRQPRPSLQLPTTPV